MTTFDTPFTREQRQAAVDAVGYWFHSVDVGDGVVSPGAKNEEHHTWEWNHLSVPDLTGRSVLDIGAWDGRYTFAAEEAGAARVVSLDHYSWSVDFPKFHEYVAKCHANGDEVHDAATVPGVWQPDTLPGKRGYDTAHELRGSKAESVVMDFATEDLTPLGRFDVVLFAGVLYHLTDPVGALRQVYEVTGDTAVIATHGIRLAGFEDRAIAEFFPHDEFAGDPSNWWVPNIKGLVGWCEGAGFSKVDVVVGPQEHVKLAPGESDTFIAVVHAHR